MPPIKPKNVHQLQGSDMLPLNRDGAGWLVDSGSVAVFAAPMDGDEPSGPRRHLFNCRKGDILFGLAGQNGSAGHGLLAIGNDKANLRQSPASRLALAYAHRQPGGITRWIDGLSAVLMDEAPREHLHRLTVSQQLELEEGQLVAVQGYTLCWFRIESGKVRLFDSEGNDVGPEQAAIPLGRRIWVRVLAPTVLRRLGPDDFESGPLLASGLALLQRACLHRLAEADHRESVAEAVRLEDRAQCEQKETAAALAELGSVLTPSAIEYRAETDLLTALAAIGNQIGVDFSAPSSSNEIRRLPDPVEAIARASSVPMRHVKLRGRWWRSDCGRLLAWIGDGEQRRPVALLRRGWHYELFDPRDESRRRVTDAVANTLSPDAVTFYRPLPASLRLPWQLMQITLRPYVKDIAPAISLAVFGALLAMLIPQATAVLMDQAIPDADRGLVVQLGLGLLAVCCGQAAFFLIQGVVTLRVQFGAMADLQTSAWDRLLRLPVRFFRGFSSGDLLNRCTMITKVGGGDMSATSIRGLVSGVMSLLNLGLLFYYSSKLALVALLITLLIGFATVALAGAARRRSLTLEQLSGSLFGFVVQLVGGISKLRVAGAEQRAFNQWARRYARQLRLTSSVQRLQDFVTLLHYALPVFSSIFFYYFAVQLVVAGEAAAATGEIDSATLTTGTFLAFNAAFGVLLAGMKDASLTFVEIMDSLAKSKLIRPIFDAAPEVDSSKVDPGRLSGQFGLQHVTFRYREDGPLVLNDVSLSAEPGEYIALVGPSGSGKSTVFRLLLGFETPGMGIVSFDHQDIADLDVTAVRRQIGVVLQQTRIGASSIQGYLSAGRQMEVDEAWEVLQEVSLADEVREMPMGLHTMISEGGGNMSGGQRQRLAVARALAQSPRILILDEATSALDNHAQAIVSESIRRRNVTRIAIAHRLSTIRSADRIFVFEAGCLVQTGSFDELAETEGLFQRMMSRQMI